MTTKLEALNDLISLGEEVYEAADPEMVQMFSNMVHAQTKMLSQAAKNMAFLKDKVDTLTPDRWQIGIGLFAINEHLRLIHEELGIDPDSEESTATIKALPAQERLALLIKANDPIIQELTINSTCKETLTPVSTAMTIVAGLLGITKELDRHLNASLKKKGFKL